MAGEDVIDCPRTPLFRRWHGPAERFVV